MILFTKTILTFSEIHKTEKYKLSAKERNPQNPHIIAKNRIEL